MASAAASPLKVLIRSSWGSDDPTRATMAFVHANALAECGHEVRIFLIGEGVSLMRGAVREAIVPVGRPPLTEEMAEAERLGVRVYACGRCCAARALTEHDLTGENVAMGSPEIFVELVEWASRILDE